MDSDELSNDLRQQMVWQQIQRRGITAPRVLEALRRVPRHLFVPSADPYDAYSDHALAIDCGQTISQPYIVGLMTQAVALEPQDRVLEIGTGSGYQTAVLAELAGHVVSLERHPLLAEQAAERLAQLELPQVEIHVADGSRGWPDAAPYDGILVAAATKEVPQALLEQLVPGGRLVIPIGSRRRQQLTLIQKTQEGDWHSTRLCPCRFVPLIEGETGE